jgi:hypothetical protein
MGGSPAELQSQTRAHMSAAAAASTATKKVAIDIISDTV